MTPTLDNVDFRLQLVHCYLLLIHNVVARVESRCRIKVNHVLLPCTRTEALANFFHEIRTNWRGPKKIIYYNFNHCEQ